MQTLLGGFKKHNTNSCNKTERRGIKSTFGARTGVETIERRDDVVNLLHALLLGSPYVTAKSLLLCDGKPSSYRPVPSRSAPDYQPVPHELGCSWLSFSLRTCCLHRRIQNWSHNAITQTGHCSLFHQRMFLVFHLLNQLGNRQNCIFTKLNIKAFKSMGTPVVESQTLTEPSYD